MNRKRTVIDFFAGSGLASLGLSDYFSPVWANDISEKKAKVYTSNHDTTFILDSIENIKGKALPVANLLWGSFPCQDLSLAGRQSGINGKRSGLFWEWIRVIDELTYKPQTIVAENVVGLLSKNQGSDFKIVHDSFVKRGYSVGTLILDASLWLPQSRKRIFLIAVREDIDIHNFKTNDYTWAHPAILRNALDRNKIKQINWNLSKPVKRQLDISDIFDRKALVFSAEETNNLISLIPDTHKNELHSHATGIFPAYKRIRNKKQVLELRFDGLSGCLRTPSGGSSRQILIIKDHNKLSARLLSIMELKRLMGAPDFYKLPGTYNDAYYAMGDAVAVPVVNFLAKELLFPVIG